MTSYLNTINSEGVVLNINNTAGFGVVIGNSLTSILGSRTFGATSIGNITCTGFATIATTLGVTGLGTFSGGLTSTAGTTILGTTTIGAITGTSASFSTTLGVTGLATFGAGGLTSTAGTTTLGDSTIGVITGTSASFTGQVTSTVSIGTPPFIITSTTNVPNLNASTLSGATFASPGAIGGTTAAAGTFTSLTGTGSVTGETGLVAGSAIYTSPVAVTVINDVGSGILGVAKAASDYSTTAVAGDTVLKSVAGNLIFQSTGGASAIKIDTSNNVTIRNTLGVTGLATFGSAGLTSTAGTTTLGSSTIGAITGTSATFSTTLGVTGLVTLTGLTTSTALALNGTKNIISVANTGTGDNVLSISPTFTGTIAAAAASFTGQITSTLSIGTPPFVITSTTNVPNLNASSLGGATFAAPGTIGSSTPAAGTFTSLTANSSFTSTAGTTSLGATTMSGAIAMANFKITGLGTPSAATDAVTKDYVDTVASGITSKTSVIAATTVAGTLVSSFENGDIIDTITLITGNRILIKDQADPIENGIYVVNASGSPTRSTDFAIGTNQGGTYVFVQEGFVNDNAGFICNSPSGSDLVGTNGISFSQFTGAAQIIAGTGLTKTGNTLSVNASQTQITSVGTLGSLAVSGLSSLTSGTFSTTLGVTGLTSLRNLDLLGSTSGIISIRTQPVSGTYDFLLPITSGSTGQLLTSGGGTVAMTWTPITGTGNVVLATNPTIGAASIGIITGTSATFSSSISSTSKTTGTITSVGGISTQENLYVGGYIGLTGSTSGTVSIKTQPTFTSWDFNLPTTVGVNGQVLTSSAGGVMTWTTPSNGTITSITLAVPSFLNVTGSPLIASGTLTVGLSGTALDIANGGTGATTLTSNAVLLGNGTSAIQSPATITYATSTLTLPKITSNDTTASTSNSIGAVLLAGGLSISNATDAVSSTNGGTFTTAGGIAVAKKAYFGTTVEAVTSFKAPAFVAKGATSGEVSILPQANAGTFNFNLPITAGATGQVLASAGGGGAAMSWITPATASAPQAYNTTGTQSQASPVDVSGLLYTSGSFDISMTVEIDAATDLTQLFKLTGILSPSSGWSITPVAISGDDTLVDFTITAGGQIQYTSGTYASFVSLTFTWARFSTTQGVGYLALSGSSSGIVTIAPQPIAGTYNYNLPITAGNSGEVLTSAGGGSSAMTWGKPWFVTTLFAAANNITSAANVTGLVYATGCFEVNVLVSLVATTNLREFFKLIGVQYGNNTSWDMAVISQAGDTTGVTFTITTGGQIQYTSANSAGFVSLTFKWVLISENYA